MVIHGYYMILIYGSSQFYKVSSKVVFGTQTPFIILSKLKKYFHVPNYESIKNESI